MLLLQLLVLRQFLVQIRLEQAKNVVRRTALDTFVDKIKSLAVDRQDSNDPPLDHPVEIAGPPFRCLFFQIDGQFFTLRLPRGRFCFGCGMDRAGEKGAREGNSGNDGQPQAAR